MTYLYAIVLVLVIAVGCTSTPVPELTPLDCRPYPKASEIDRIDGCAYRDREGKLIANPGALDRHFNEHDLVPVVLAGRLFLAHRSGRMVQIYVVDNGPDYFSEGRARFLRGNQVGFVDRALRPVITAQWDWASPFESGLAAVCEGCRDEAATPGSEHRRMSGGRWGYIDRFGNRILPLNCHEDDLPPKEVLDTKPASEN